MSDLTWLPRVHMRGIEPIFRHRTAFDGFVNLMAACRGQMPLPPQPHGLAPGVDTTLEQQILHIPETERDPYIYLTANRIISSDELKQRS